METPAEDYLNVIRHTQLISLDLIVSNERNEVLLGYRRNNPARNYWFTFGARVFKEEKFEEACRRVSRNEIGTSIELKDCLKNGVYIHTYNNNFQNDDFGTTYFVFAYKYKCERNDIVIRGDDQHSDFRWFSFEELMAREDVHPFVKNYFREADNRVW